MKTTIFAILLVISVYSCKKDDLSIDTSWQNLTLLNNWKGSNDTIFFQYRKDDNGFIYLRTNDAIGGGTGIIATLPEGFRPSVTKYAFVFSSVGEFGSCQQVLNIYSNGNIELSALQPNPLFASFSLSDFNFMQ
ncbi:MAG: hypothetical protein PHW73_00930 [Atribacterota bacterium]|nr:hypothetical protein [Atribacterota bacterium]